MTRTSNEEVYVQPFSLAELHRKDRISAARWQQVEDQIVEVAAGAASGRARAAHEAYAMRVTFWPLECAALSISSSIFPMIYFPKDALRSCRSTSRRDLRTGIASYPRVA